MKLWQIGGLRHLWLHEGPLVSMAVKLLISPGRDITHNF